MQASNRNLTPGEARNKAVVLEYFEQLTQRWDFDAARAHIGATFTQHNPTIADGVEGLRAWVTERPPFTNELRADIKRILVDGNFVMLHSVVSAPALLEMPPMCIADIFRLQDGKVVEHWDVLQPMPDEALHANGIA